LAKRTAPIFKKHGALRVVETWGDDVPEGKITSFPMAVKLEADETVVFSWIIWPNKDTRDTGMKASMEDPDMDYDSELPFDGKRMIFGGFEIMFDQ
jgi:uncharacterized protein YbaA (DUF1428 family)